MVHFFFSVGTHEKKEKDDVDTITPMEQKYIWLIAVSSLLVVLILIFVILALTGKTVQPSSITLGGWVEDGLTTQIGWTMVYDVDGVTPTNTYTLNIASGPSDVQSISLKTPNRALKYGDQVSLYVNGSYFIAASAIDSSGNASMDQEFAVTTAGTPMPLNVRAFDTSQAQSTATLESGDLFVLAATTDTNNTSSCGWYGCRVLQVKNGEVVFKHGNDLKDVIVFTNP